MLERVAGDKGELQLQRRGNDYELIYNGVFLMASYNGRGEQEMVQAALAPWHRKQLETEKEICVPTCRQQRPFLKVLMGGLGFGFGLQQALTSPLVARVDLLEIEEAVIRWNRQFLKALNDDALEDIRVMLYREDVVPFLQNKTVEKSYHAIIMDIDNGPDWLSRSDNRFLYSKKGTALLQKLLLPGGSLSVWSAAPAPAYLKLLQQYFPLVHEKKVTEQTGHDSYYYLAVKGQV